MDPIFLAQSKFRRKKYDEVIEICGDILDQQPLDQAAWFLKTRALTMKDYIEDMDMEEEGIAEIIMDDNAMASAPRPGTSLRAPTAAGNAGAGGGSKTVNQLIRPMTGSGRPLSGFARPGTGNRGASRGGSMEGAFKGSRPGTSRPVSVAGRFVRLGTQSMLSKSDKFIDADRYV